MDASVVYIGLSILVLAIIAGLIFLMPRRGNARALTPLAGLAFAFILAGMLFGENRWLGYGLMGMGVLLAVGDMVYKLRVKS